MDTAPLIAIVDDDVMVCEAGMDTAPPIAIVDDDVMVCEAGMDTAPLIAIVDDDVMVCEAVKDLVESFGFEASTFTSAAEFLGCDCVSTGSCVIADVQMPGMNGLELHRALIASGRQTPVIFITAFPDERVRNRALSAGAVGYLRKPFDGQSLLNCIRSALGR